ncbi:MAG: hypothetical protein R3C01_08465 [Planctomycetaceae bacterium]
MHRFYALTSLFTVLLSSQVLFAQPPAPAGPMLAPVPELAGDPAEYHTGEYSGGVCNVDHNSLNCPPASCPAPIMRYDLPSKHYGIWTRPAAFAEDSSDNCKSMRRFAPRGYGVPYRRACERLDYAPHELRSDPSFTVPAYYGKYEKAPCKACMQGHHN